MKIIKDKEKKMSKIKVGDKVVVVDGSWSMSIDTVKGELGYCLIAMQPKKVFEVLAIGGKYPTVKGSIVGKNDVILWDADTKHLHFSRLEWLRKFDPERILDTLFELEKALNSLNAILYHLNNDKT